MDKKGSGDRSDIAYLINQCKKENAVGYCHNKKHKGYLSEKILRQHKCNTKQCMFLERYETMTYWLRRRIRAALKKYNKNGFGRILIGDREVIIRDEDRLVQIARQQALDTGKAPQILYVKESETKMIRVQKREKLAEYQNGNIYTELYSDGTRIRQIYGEEFYPVFAENIDVHISSRCNNNCSMCYAGCTKDGAYGNLTGKWIETLHKGTEIAVNLNFPMHPSFMNFAKRIKEMGVILNATVNQRHFEKHQEFIRTLYKEGLIYGLGISLAEPTEEFIKLVKAYPNAVIHVITGIFSEQDFKALADNDLKLLVLGYKNIGRGKEYNRFHELQVKQRTFWLKENFVRIKNGFAVVSFDNLALDQLDIKSNLSDSEWEEFYCGDDGTISFYINTVEGYFAKNSVTDKHYPINDLGVDEMFSVIRTIGKESNAG